MVFAVSVWQHVSKCMFNSSDIMRPFLAYGLYGTMLNNAPLHNHSLCNGGFRAAAVATLSEWWMNGLVLWMVFYMFPWQQSTPLFCRYPYCYVTVCYTVHGYIRLLWQRSRKSIDRVSKIFYYIIFFYWLACFYRHRKFAEIRTEFRIRCG